MRFYLLAIALAIVGIAVNAALAQMVPAPGANLERPVVAETSIARG